MKRRGRHRLEVVARRDVGAQQLRHFGQTRFGHGGQRAEQVAPLKGYSGYQTPLKACIGEGLLWDEAKFAPEQTARLIEALKKRRISKTVLDRATRDLSAA